MFDRFTERANAIIDFANDEASRLGSPAAGTSHVLLGMLLEPNGIAGVVLREFNVDPDAIAKASPSLVTVNTVIPSCSSAREKRVADALSGKPIKWVAPAWTRAVRKSAARVASGMKLCGMVGANMTVDVAARNH